MGQEEMSYSESSEPVRCGVGWFSTGPDDPLIDCCQWHDAATLKGSWAQQNMTYEQVHEKFVSLMEEAAKGRPLIEARKVVYDNLEHAFGKRFWEGNIPLMWVAIHLPENTAVACKNFYCAEELILEEYARWCMHSGWCVQKVPQSLRAMCSVVESHLAALKKELGGR